MALSEEDRRLLAEDIAIEVTLDPGRSLWPSICEALGGEHVATHLRPVLTEIGRRYHLEKRSGVLNKTRRSRLQKLITSCRRLQAAVETEKDWVSLHLDYDFGFFAEEDPPLLAFAAALEASIRDHDEDPSGSRESNGKLQARRNCWIGLAQIYEDATGRRVATSKDPTTSKVCGPFVRLVEAFSRVIMRDEQVTPDMIDAFVDWYHSPASEPEREFVTSVMSIADAVRPQGENQKKKMN